MSATEPTGLTIEALAAALRAADPRALLVSARILRRVIKHDRAVQGIGLQVPHRKSYVIPRERFLALVDADELELPPGTDLPPLLLLIVRPPAHRLESAPPAAALREYWRLLFHIRVHAALDGQLSGDAVEDRVRRIGPVALEEIAAVLRHERMLLPPGDEASVHAEFAALWLEQRFFAPMLRSCWFPGITDFKAIDTLVAEDIDGAVLLARTRLAGAAEPTPLVVEPEAVHDDDPDASTQADTGPASEPGAAGPLLRRADVAFARGNVVRSALLRTRAAALYPSPQSRSARDALRDLARLVQRLREALDLDGPTGKAWRKVLPALLPAAAHGIWPAAARLLYDLQKACVDSERVVYKLDLLGWLGTLGERPLKRPLAHQQEVLKLKHLRSALARVSASRLGDHDRRRLAQLLQAAIHHTEERIRERFRPLLTGALEAADLRPQNYPERISRDKLVEELLDRIVARGFTTMGDLRDAVSRNQLKLPDLASAGVFFTGDPLLLVDQRLADAMPGVHRRGEVYMRWLQRFSSLGFGTPVGRFLTRYVALPFGGAFVVLEGSQHVVEPLAKMVAGRPVTVHLLNEYSFLLLGLFLLGVLHVAPFRSAVGSVLTQISHGLRGLLLDLPAAVLRWPLLQRLLTIPLIAKLKQWVLKPALLAAPVSLLFPMLGASGTTWATGATMLFLASAIVLNTRVGRDIEEVCTDRLQRVWHRVSIDLLPNVFNFVMEFFRRILEGVERVLYTVDEWLRFRSGDSQVSLVVKPVLGLFWAGIAYVVRFCVNLLIEPQVNPIKHFPVVTVSHKLVLTMGLVPMIHLLEAVGLSEPEAISTATAIAFSIPGIFGFLVWELKENWRLYLANRAGALQPAVVGSHGETMARLLRPGFHSGTLPKTYARLRKAVRRACRGGKWKPFRKQRDALHHVEESVHHFLDREFVQLLNGSKSWGTARLHVGHIFLATNSIRIEVNCPGRGPSPLCLEFVERSDQLSARIAQPGWQTALSDSQRRALSIALAGLICRSSADEMNPPLAWNWWVDAWEQDQAGKELPDLPARLPVASLSSAHQAQGDTP